MSKLSFFNEEDVVSKTKDDRKKVYLADNNLILQPNEEQKIYLVAIKYKNENQEEYKRIDYRMDVQKVPNEITKEHLFKVNNRNFYINKRKTVSIIEEIAENVNNIIYPINLIVNNNGSIKEINNISEIQNRWEDEKVNFKRNYRGAIYNKLITQINNKIYDEIKLEDSLSKNIAFCLFFNKKYLKYDENLICDSNLIFPTDVKTANLTYKGKNKIKPFINKYGSIELHFQGEAALLKNNSLQYKFPNEKLYSEMSVLYDLDTETKMPSLIKATCKILNKKKKHIKSIEVLITEEV